MSLENRESRVVFNRGQNLNAVANSNLLIFAVSKPIMIQRFAVISDAAAGLLAPMVLKLRITSIGVTSDLGTDLLNGVALAQGLGIYKDITGPPNGLRVNAGDIVSIAVSVPAGGVSTGDISLEYWELPFAGQEITAFRASL